MMNSTIVASGSRGRLARSVGNAPGFCIRPLIILFVSTLCASCGEQGQSQSVAEPESKTRLRVLSYNVMLGFVNGKPKAIKWIASQRPDVVALQELKGYTEEMLKEDARSWGHPHAVLSERKAGLRLGLTSRKPIEDAHSITRSGIRLGMLHGQTHGIDFFVLHLGHGSDEIRMQETGIVLTEIRKIESADRPTVVLGDFNSVSRHDREFYERNNVETPTGFLYKRNKWDFAILNLDVMDQYLTRGWVDVVHQHQGVLTRKQASWPSLVFKNNKIHVRVDFVLASSSLAKRCLFARVMKDPATDYLSDHYPVMADFDWPRTP